MGNPKSVLQFVLTQNKFKRLNYNFKAFDYKFDVQIILWIVHFMIEFLIVDCKLEVVNCEVGIGIG